MMKGRVSERLCQFVCVCVCTKTKQSSITVVAFSAPQVIFLHAWSHLPSRVGIARQPPRLPAAAPPRPSRNPKGCTGNEIAPPARGEGDIEGLDGLLRHREGSPVPGIPVWMSRFLPDLCVNLLLCLAFP